MHPQMRSHVQRAHASHLRPAPALEPCYRIARSNPLRNACREGFSALREVKSLSRLFHVQGLIQSIRGSTAVREHLACEHVVLHEFVSPWDVLSSLSPDGKFQQVICVCFVERVGSLV